MSGHSKWATTKHKKGAIDAKRGKIFSKLAKLITVAAREGGDPDMNFALRLAVDRAKAVNMPKENIDRAIARGAGTGEGGALETAVYECMGPGGVAMLIVALTDNTNRAYTNIKTICNKSGGNMEAKVLWQFHQKGVVHTPSLSASGLIGEFSEGLTRDDIELAFIEAGAEDISVGDEDTIVTCEVKDFKSVTDTVRRLGLEISEAGLEYVPTSTTEVSEEDGEKLARFVDALEEDEDVDAVYTNAA